MDSNNWRQPPQTEQPPMDAAGGEWRSLLPPDSRSRIVNKIMDTLKRHLPSSGHEGVQELKKIAMRFEEKIYYAATSQSDYLRRISLKMLTMESKSNPPGPMPNAMPSNSAGMSRNSQDPGSQSMQPQVQNQGQSLPIPMASNQPTVQGRPQLLTQNIQSNINNAGVQSSATALPSVNSLAKNNMPNVMQNSNMQNMSGISQSSMGNSMVQGVASNNYNSQKQQMQGRQNMQQVGSQQQIQQPQNQQQFMYQQQQLMKQKLQQGAIQQPLLQPHMQQQTQQNNLLPSAQLQSSQQPVMQNSSVMQPSMVSGLQQNQPSSIQQSSQSVHQQLQQSVLRQQQQQGQQAPVHHQQMSQQPMLQSQQQQQQQQQHLMGQQQIGQQTSMPDIQQQQQPQRMLSQQNNLASMSGQQQSNQNLQQQQLMGQQSNLSSMHQQQLSSQTHVGTLPQQQQMLGSQSGNSSMATNQHPAHMLQQSKVMAQQQNPNGSALLSGGGQQQMMPQMQSQTQLQQQLGLQQQSNSLQHNMQQRIQTPNALLQPQNGIDPQKMFQSQWTPAEGPSSSLDSTAQTGNSDAQEEVYQKIKVMKDLYFAEIHDIYQKICSKLQQHEPLSQQAKSEAFERLKMYKHMIERILHCLQLSKSNAHHFHKDKLASLEKQILSILNTHRPRKPGPPLQQGQIPPSHMQSLQQNQQPHSQIPQNQSLENGVNSQLQSVNVQGSSVPKMQPGDMSGLHGSVSSLSGITSSQQNMIQPGSNLDSGQGNVPTSIQQVAAGSIQQNPVSAPQQANPQTGMNLLHSNMNSLQPNPNMLQSQHIKQQQEQQLKQQFQSRHIQQQMLHKQQLLQQQQQQQQLHMQQIKQQPGQMQGHQMSQLHQMNDVNDIKLRQSMGLKPGLPQHLSQGQRYQQLKPGVSFPNSSPQVLQAGSPQINQHSSPQIDQQNLLPPITKVGTPLQSANSPFVPSVSPLAPSPMPGDPEKPNPATSNAANNMQQQTSIAPASSLAIGTPGISASPLLAESSPPDGHGATLNTLSGKPGVTDQPLERLLKVVKSMSSKALNSAVGDIVSVVSMIDRIAGSAPGNGSRAAVGEDLVAMTKCRLQARNFITQDGSSGMKRMRRYTSAMPLNVASSVGSPNNSFKQLTGSETSELESTATSSVKRRRIEVHPAIVEEIKEINEHLIDTVVDLSDEDVDPTLSAAAVEGGEGTVVKCTFSAVSLGPNLKSQYCSAQMSPIQPLRLLVPANYPNCSPILLDKFPVEVSKEYDDLSVKVKSRFSISLRALSQPMSLREIARTWDDCARSVITEYAQLSGGGTFSSKYGTWENCLTAN